MEQTSVCRCVPINTWNRVPSVWLPLHPRHMTPTNLTAVIGLRVTVGTICPLPPSPHAPCTPRADNAPVAVVTVAVWVTFTFLWGNRQVTGMTEIWKFFYNDMWQVWQRYEHFFYNDTWQVWQRYEHFFTMTCDRYDRDMNIFLQWYVTGMTEIWTFFYNDPWQVWQRYEHFYNDTWQVWQRNEFFFYNDTWQVWQRNEFFFYNDTW